MAADPDAVGVEAPESATRRAILDATERLLQEGTLDELSVAEILEEANVSRATFYFYFASKDDAFIALLDDVMADMAPRFEAIMTDVERRRSPRLRQDIAEWLSVEPPHRAVMRSAVEEWPRRPELREVYLARQARMAQTLAQAIDEDRKAGVALESIPSAQLAAGWIWTMERAWYQAVGGADHLHDLPAINDALAAALVSAIYGT
jgi:TetR/AcrR family transcriptional regulator, ethionamide resistance regulator